MPNPPALSDRLRRFLPERWRKTRPRVAVLRLQGAIGAISPLRPGLSIGALAPSLERAFSLPQLSGVALIVNSPGGSAAQSHLIYRRIRTLATEKGVPVFAFVEDAAASGGYMIACAADEIFADPASLVGSIGVVSIGAVSLLSWGVGSLIVVSSFAGECRCSPAMTTIGCTAKSGCRKRLRFS